jgi:hypothetical protein
VQGERERLNVTHNELAGVFEEFSGKECGKLREQLMKEVQQWVAEGKGKGDGEEL